MLIFLQINYYIIIYNIMPNVCKNDYKAAGFSSYDECCEEYPDFCSDAEIELPCSLMTAYKHFDFNICMPDGWPQKNNDCWLDSSLYAMFAPEKSSRLFAVILDSLNESEDEDEKQIAYYISNYLNGINDHEWTETEKCKQKCKNKIVKYLLSWNKNHNYDLNIGDAEAIKFAFHKDSLDDYDVGPQAVLFNFFTLISQSKIDLPKIKLTEQTDNMVNSLCSKSNPKPLKNIIEAILTTPLTDDIQVVSLNSIDIDKCSDKTRILEIKQINGYSLQSMVYGSGAHIIAASLCKNNFVSYDNMKNPQVNSNINNTDEYFTFAQQIILIYLKDSASVIGGFRSIKGIKSRKMRKSRKVRKSGKSKKARKSGKSKKNRK